MARNYLEVSLEGLIGLVPNKDKEYGNGEIIAVLPDLRQGCKDPRLPNDDDGVRVEVEPHLPAIVVPAENIAELPRVGAFFDFVDDGVRFTAIPIAREQVSVQGLATNAPVVDLTGFEDYFSGPSLPPRGRRIRRELKWIPPLFQANSADETRQTGRFDKKRLINPDGTPRATGSIQLSGTFPITRGELYVAEIASNNAGIIEYSFQAPGTQESEWSQCVHEYIAWDAPLDGDTAELVITSDAEPESRRSVRLTATNGRIPLRLVNIEVKYLVSSASRNGTNALSVDYDYCVAYLLCTKVPDNLQGLPIPHIQTVDPEGDQGNRPRGSSSPRCRLPRFL